MVYIRQLAALRVVPPTEQQPGYQALAVPVMQGSYQTTRKVQMETAQRAADIATWHLQTNPALPFGLLWKIQVTHRDITEMMQRVLRHHRQEAHLITAWNPRSKRVSTNFQNGSKYARVEGIEPSLSVLETEVLPLNDTRKCVNYTKFLLGFLRSRRKCRNLLFVVAKSNSSSSN